MQEDASKAGKVVFVDNIPTPYRVCLYNAIKAAAPFEICVVYLSKKGNEKLWVIDNEVMAFRHCFGRSVQVFVRSLDVRFQFTFGILRTLLLEKPSVVVVGGYEQLGYWTALLYCKLTNTPLVLWAGTTEMSSRSRSWPVSRLRKWYISACGGFIAYGSKAAEFLIARGARKERIVLGFNTTDLSRIRRRSKDLSESRELLAEREGLSKPILTFVGRLTHLKGLALVLEALARIKDDHSFSLIVVGDGHERAVLEDQCKRLQLEQRVRFVGYRQASEVIYYLSLGDIFVFPTLQEVWGLVVNEALACGEYVISSIYAGSTYDLVIGPHMGVAVDPLNSRELESAIAQAISNIDWIQKGREARSLEVQRFSANNVAKTIVEGLSKLLDAPLRREDHARS